MKNKYKGITIPYYYYDKKRLHSYFIYKNKEYTDLSKVLNAFLNTQLTYHYNIEKEENEVHNLSDVLYAICQNPKEFSIPNKYKNIKLFFGLLATLSRTSRGLVFLPVLLAMPDTQIDRHAETGVQVDRAASRTKKRLRQ